MRFGILGPLEVVDDDGRQREITARKLSALLAIMLIHRGEPVVGERLADELWGEAAPPSAAKTVQVYISRLRRELGADLVQTRGQSYVLAVAPGSLDVDVFERLAGEGRAALQAGNPLLAGQRLRPALELFRGAPLADFTYEPFAQAEIARLEEARMNVLEDRIEADLACGWHHQLVAELEALVREHPRRERLRGQLMLALYRSGRHGDALDSYRSARRELVDELGIEPSRTLQELHQAMLEQDPRLDLAAPADVPSQEPELGARLTNLPPRTRRLVGRDRELSELCELLTGGTETVVSVTGIGGSGKTLLAMAVGFELLEWALGGVFLVRLSATQDADAILPMIAEAVEVKGDGETSLASALARRLGQQPTLLILDNFEQLVHAAAAVADLAAHAPELRVLVTSQVPLRVSGERVFALGPLARTDAITLFLDRARARDREFQPEDDDLAAIERVCALLDGTPLAIELAAARLGPLGPVELLERLERPLSLLTRGDRNAPARQRSLRAAIDWTHALLEPSQRAVFARFGVCAGAVPLSLLAATATTTGSEPGLIDDLGALLDFSFVRRQHDRQLGTCFTVAQALRDYALERLIEAGQEDETRRRHATHVARVAHAARLVKWGASDEQRAELLALSGEIRPAVAWARTNDPELHVRLCSALAAFWVYGGVLSEVIDELRHARESGAGSVADRAWVLSALAKCAQLESANYDARALTDQALTEWNAVDDELERALGLDYLSWVVRWEARYDEAIAMADESLAVLRRTGDRRLILRGLVFLAHAYADAQAVQETESVLREAAELANGDPVWELAAIHGDCETYKGADRPALACYAESLAWTSTTGESHQMQMDMSCMVLPFARLGHAEAALEVSELVRLERERTGRPGDLPTGMVFLQTAIAMAREQVDQETAEAARARAHHVPVINRAAHTIEIANQVLAAAGPADHH